MEKWIYEAKPVVMIGVAVAAFIQIDKNSSLFVICGYILLFSAVWIFYARLKHRGFLKKGSEAAENLNQDETAR